MSWTDDQLDKLRTKMGEVKRQGGWISASEANLVATLIQAIRRFTRATGWSGIPDGRLPTIGETRGQGITKLTVTCSTPQCWQSRRFGFEELGLSDDIVFVEIPRHVRFVCRKCRGRNVRVMADWPSALQGKSGESHNHAPR